MVEPTEIEYKKNGLTAIYIGDSKKPIGFKYKDYYIHVEEIEGWNKLKHSFDKGRLMGVASIRNPAL